MAAKNQEAKLEEWLRGQLETFVLNTKAKVFIYAIDQKEIRDYIREGTEVLDDREKRMEQGFVGADLGLSEEEWKKFWNSEDGPKIAKRMQSERRKLSVRMDKGRILFEDKEGVIFNFRNGYRVTKGVPDKSFKRIFMYGPCIVVGGYCKDDQTIASYLQQKLNKEKYPWSVFNKGLCGPDDCFGIAFMEELSQNDVVIMICDSSWVKGGQVLENGKKLREITSVYMVKKT